MLGLLGEGSIFPITDNQNGGSHHLLFAVFIVHHLKQKKGGTCVKPLLIQKRVFLLFSLKTFRKKRTTGFYCYSIHVFFLFSFTLSLRAAIGPWQKGNHQKVLNERFLLKGYFKPVVAFILKRKKKGLNSVLYGCSVCLHVRNLKLKLTTKMSGLNHKPLAEWCKTGV